MRRKILCILLYSVSNFSNATDLPIRNGMSFLSARKLLMKNDWKPIKSADETLGGMPPETKLLKMGVIELDGCGMGYRGVELCNFNYKKNDRCLGVSTVGEEVKELVITGWAFTCPGKN